MRLECFLFLAFLVAVLPISFIYYNRCHVAHIAGSVPSRAAARPRRPAIYRGNLCKIRSQSSPPAEWGRGMDVFVIAQSLNKTTHLPHQSSKLLSIFSSLILLCPLGFCLYIPVHLPLDCKCVLVSFMPIACLRPVLVLVSHCCRHPSFARDRHQQ